MGREREAVGACLGPINHIDGVRDLFRGQDLRGKAAETGCLSVHVHPYLISPTEAGAACHWRDDLA